MMLFHYITIFVTCVLFSASASFAGEPTELESRFAAQLERDVESQVSNLVAQRLSNEVAALTVPSALPAPGPVRHASPVASATSARALPNGELTPARLACQASEAQVSCQMMSADTALAAHTPR